MPALDPRSSEQRVAVTGIGVVTPIGTGRATFWQALLDGKSGIRPVVRFDTSKYPVHLGAEVLDFSFEPYFSRTDPALMGRASHMAVAAAKMALEDAQADVRQFNPSKTGVSLGTTSGEAEFIELLNDARKSESADPGSVLPRYPSHRMPRNVAAEFGLHGPCIVIPTACAAGNYAIGHAVDCIRSGRAERMLAGGADMFSRIPYSGFARLGAIATERCQPFDRNRKGMVPGEGAAMLLLERWDLAQAAGRKIYAEVLGYGISCDAHHMTAAHPEGAGAVRAMASAIEDSGVTLEDIDYVSAHGTGTPTNDRIESIAMNAIFGERASQVPLSSIKSMLGHTMGAASAIEAAACALALDTGWVPPTINHEEADDGCVLDFVPNRPRQVHPQVVLNNAYAFGGNNACLCLRRTEG